MCAEAPVNRIINFSAVDGAGCRMAVFVQGCNMLCGYCHNPETRRLCLNCGECVPLCKTGALSFSGGKVEFNRTLCTGCDSCISACAHSASPRVEMMSAMMVIERAKALMPFIRGITVSGGECTLYPEFLEELALGAAKLGLGVLLDSNGLEDITPRKNLLANVEGVLLDIKPYDGALDAELENAAKLADMKKIREVRLVVFPAGGGAAKSAISKLMKTVSVHTPLRISPFRPYGVRGEMGRCSPPLPDEIEDVVSFARRAGFSSIYIN